VHPLLSRQLREASIDRSVETPELVALLAMIGEAYAVADDERRRLERSLVLTTEELHRRLEHELEGRRRLEVELQHAEKLRAVGQLAAGIAHEINTPIQFIGDSVSFLVEAFAEIGGSLAPDGSVAPPQVDAGELEFLREQIPRALNRCRTGVDRVAGIVRALSCLAQPDGDDQQTADLHAAVTSTLIVVASELKYVAEVELDLAATCTLRCHIGDIQQVLLHLLVNAGHAIAERVRGSSGRGTVRIATRDDGPDIVTTISDDGAGVPDEIRARIFEPFFTTKPLGQGTGQGLALVHALIVERHAGQISFESTVGKGTTFTFRLPVAGRPPKQA
jgi:signal transduction histidine kinase